MLYLQVVNKADIKPTKIESIAIQKIPKIIFLQKNSLRPHKFPQTSVYKVLDCVSTTSTDKHAHLNPLAQLGHDDEVEDEGARQQRVLAGVVHGDGVLAPHEDLRCVLVQGALGVANVGHVLDHHLWADVCMLWRRRNKYRQKIKPKTDRGSFVRVVRDGEGGPACSVFTAVVRSPGTTFLPRPDEGR